MAGGKKSDTTHPKIGGLEGFLKSVLPASLANGLFGPQANTGAQPLGNVQETVKKYPTAQDYYTQFGATPPQGIYDENGLPIQPKQVGGANASRIQNSFMGGK